MHAIGEFVLCDTSLNGGVFVPRSLGLVELSDCVQHTTSLRPAKTRGIVKVQDGIALSAELYALEASREKTGTPEAVVQRLSRLAGTVGCERYVGGQIRVVGTEPVTYPRANARAAGNYGSRLEAGGGGIMVDGFSVHGLDYANVVDHLCEVGQGFAEFDATATMASEANGGRSDRETGLSRGHRGLAFVGID